MSVAVLTLFLIKFAAFSITGLAFFHKGRHGLMWFLTLAPMPLNAALLCAFYAGALPSWVDLGSPLYAQMTVLGTLLCASAIALFFTTLGSHRIAIPMWHQNERVPTGVVSWGPYRLMRHPFYASYLLYYAGTLLVAPTWWALLNGAYAFLVLNHTAAKEERQLLESELGRDYARYLAVTRRFLPFPAAARPAPVLVEREGR